MDFAIPSEWRVSPLPWKDFCPTTERLEELNVGVGDDVVMLGRFAGHSGRQRNQPLARFGSIAMMVGAAMANHDLAAFESAVIAQAPPGAAQTDEVWREPVKDVRAGEVAAERAERDPIVGSELPEYLAGGSAANQLSVGLQAAKSAVALHRPGSSPSHKRTSNAPGCARLK